MPEVAANTTEAVLGMWSVPEGARFHAGNALASVETAKAVVDVEADRDGTLVRALVGAGTEVSVGAPIALLAGVDEHVTDVDAAVAALLGRRSATARTFASPLARRLARTGGI